MENYLTAAVFCLLTVIEGAHGLSCYVGTSGSLTTMSGCTKCQKTTTSSGSITTYSSACVSTCTSTSYTLYGNSISTSCCSTDYCNGYGSSSGSSSTLSCYVGSPGYLTSTSGCTSCQKVVYTYSGYTTSSSSCLTTSCSAGTSSYTGYTVNTYCCSTNNCNGDTFGGGSGGGSSSGGLRCYEGSQGSLVSRTGCTSCQKYVYTNDGSQTSSFNSYCLSYTCTPSSSSLSGITTSVYCCSTDDCNDAAFVGDTTNSAGGIRCYEGSQGSLVSKSGCTSCQKMTTSGGLTMTTSSCLSTSCTPGTFSLGGYSVQTTCCSTDNCNGANRSRLGLPFAVFMAAIALWALVRL